MEKTTTGTVISVKKQWWLKVNTKMIRAGALDGAIFPHILKVKYIVDGKEYVRRKWILTKNRVPEKGDAVQVLYDDRKPERIKLIIR
jgi:hypothetical protein